MVDASKPAAPPWAVETLGDTVRIVSNVTEPGGFGDDVPLFGDCREAGRVANARLAVRAVNCHAELLAALRSTDETLGRWLATLYRGSPLEREIRAAIARAEGRTP